MLDDAQLEHTVDSAVSSRFDNSGQTCIAAKRFIVVDAIADRFIERFVAAASRRVVGDPQQEGTTLAPMARADLRDELHKQVQASVEKGAKVLLGGEPVAGSHAGYPATILDHVAPDMPAYEEEFFGPVASIQTFKSEDEVVKRANDTEYGLVAYLYTKDLSRGMRVSEKLDFGMIGLNRGLVSDPAAPFGGTKQSGLGREGGQEGMKEFLEMQYVSTNW